jgi:hypothetical protein
MKDTDMRACAKAKLELLSGEGAQRPRGALNYYHATVGPKRHQGHRRTRGGIRSQEGCQRDRRAHGGSKTKLTRAQRGDQERHQEDRREQRGDRSRP